MTFNFKDWTDNPLPQPQTVEGGYVSPNGVRTLAFSSVEAMVGELKPSVPVHCLRPQILQQTAQWFLQNFQGDVLYAVKCNPEPAVLHYLHDAGVRHFDIASIKEAKLVSQHAKGAKMYYMHPVKSRASIRDAYFNYGIRDFALDSFEELHKIIEETKSATDLRLHVRLGLPRGTAAHDLSGKFGATPEATAELLQAVDKIAAQVGLCFHVGSQCMNPESFRRALRTVGQVLALAQIELDVLDVGGGFPAIYPGLTPPPLSQYMDAIHKGIAELNLPRGCKIWCEPGRAIVAEAGSLVVNVELRKDNALYINDGIYGSLFDAGLLNTRYPTKLVRASGSEHKAAAKSFHFFGPTCDSVDVMKGPFMLPNDVTEGDWIEIGQLGAYCISMRSQFNGFDDCLQVEVWDQPMLRMPDYQPKTDRRVINKDSVWNLNVLAALRGAYEVEMS